MNNNNKKNVPHPVSFHCFLFILCGDHNTNNNFMLYFVVVVPLHVREINVSVDGKKKKKESPSHFSVTH